MKRYDSTTENVSEILTERLLRWYRANARDLPWRQTRDPYRIWVSEIMLQQTRVAAVLGYYARFMEVFPTVEALAAAPEDVLLKCWEGLGYYSRARNLQKAARVVTEECGGRFPADYDALLALPGIGEYTAGAIASAAFGLPIPAVDGNVLRVMTRLTDCHDDITQPAVKKAAKAWAARYMPAEPEDIRIFNQALMELGATVCGPNTEPKCDACPLAELCVGRQRGTAADLPVKAAKKARTVQEMTVYIFERDGRIALRRRPKEGLLAGLWEFPNVPGAAEESAAGAAVENWGLAPLEWNKKLTAKHIFTHREWHMTGYALRVTGAGPADFVWVDGTELENHAVPSAFARYYEEAREILKRDFPEKENG